MLPPDVKTAAPSERELAAAIEAATRTAVTELFATRREAFYYVALVTTGDASPPVLSAWSFEALEATCMSKGLQPADLKWSYADSPYFGFGEHYFHDVRSLFSRRPPMDPTTSRGSWETEHAARLSCMERALLELDRQGLFGVREARLGVLINAEVMPPDESNTLRAIRLNPHGALKDWLREAAEHGASKMYLTTY